MKHFILCADDYGQNTAISQAIIDLIKKNHISATSCMTNSYYWIQHAKWLESLKDRVDVGLHFNLTEGKPLTRDLPSDLIPLNELIFKAYTRKLNLAAIEAELNAQIDQFVAGAGYLPNFIDGHQHIHQLPGIRDVFFHVYEKRLRQAGCYVRCTANISTFWRFTEPAYFKRIMLQSCGAFKFKSELIKRKIPHNSSFSGMYHFANAENFALYFPRFLKEIRDNGIVMCHPGLESTGEEDEISHARFYEYQYLISDLFEEDCKTQSASIARFTHG